MENGAGLISATELKIVERYKRAAREEMDGPKLLNLLEEIEDEIRRRTALVFEARDWRGRAQCGPDAAT
ncbi:hypothetical protein [Bradyrhizobium sp. 195]|uniref:hypothetical protein n=1 Tax=Bradyrhizobium sp. 195 TaxID=2782662 RepID=UPI002001D84D|nr:hypothetical protein [Bradyrhizobium sp. 195]UPK31133.1 hypothetical protein IVB26_38905 [Bradyrhizobium sp. 195]